MSRDTKPRKTQPAKKKAAGGTLVGMFIGLVLGVGLAAGVVWYFNKSPLPFVERVQPPRHAENKAGEPNQPLALPGKPGDPIPEKRFQFYDILPGKTEAVPEKSVKPAPAKEEPKKEETKKEEPKKEAAKEMPKDVKKEEPRKEEAPKKEEAKKEEPKKEEPKKEEVSKTPLFLQAGSFSTAQDADNQKAKLAFMGHEAVVQQVMIQDRTLYRVRIGPYTKIDELNKVRSELAKSGLDAQLSK